MRVWRGNGLDPARDLGGDAPSHPVVTIGVFDGVHRGHQKIIEQARWRARSEGRPLLAVTFDPIPERVLRPEQAPPLLATPHRRLELLAECGIDAAYVVEFNRDFSALAPEEFVKTVLLDGLNASAVVVGRNFRFGHRAAGDVGFLARVAEAAGISVDVVDLLLLDIPPDDDPTPDSARPRRITVSSSWIRDRIAVGAVAEAAVALGRPHRLEGVVIHGDHRGRELGFPTANIDVVPELAIPADGVYAGRLSGMPAAISVGANVTFGGAVRRVEAYVLDRADLDLYGSRVELDFVRRIRGMVDFGDAQTLRRHITDDVERCREILT
ncbi:MAG: bifunctional riboflavin kinase/FAD synthetase [Acidothermus sp.]|nr:bifunctional riboflavin kinase/FAD synthetase [Acidothermus sp.]